MSLSRQPIKRSTYRPLSSDEPDPEHDPLVYATSDGRYMKRWKVGTRQYVERVVRDEAGQLVRSRPLRAKRIDIAEANRRYEAGESLPVIARAIGADTGQLSRVLRKVGLSMRTPTDYARPLDEEEVRRRYQAGEGYSTIARDMGVSAERVKGITKFVGNRGPGRVKGLGRSGGRVTYETEFKAMRPIIHARSGGRCEATASLNCVGSAGHVHHRKLRAQGGQNSLENLIDVCSFCHSFLHHNPTLAYERGLLVRRDTDPASVPVVMGPPAR